MSIWTSSLIAAIMVKNKHVVEEPIYQFTMSLFTPVLMNSKLVAAKDL